MSKAPTCINHGCSNPCHVSKKSFRGHLTYRCVCGRCHRANMGKTTYAEGVTVFKKDYCENIDGRLGYKCTATIVNSCQLSMDHIDGTHNNNVPENVQTICFNCHTYKTKINKDNNGAKDGRL